MSIRVRCVQCQQAMKAPDSAAGKVVKCPGCGQRMRLPAGGSQAKPKRRPRPQPAAEPDFEDYDQDLDFSNLPLDDFGDMAPAAPSKGRRKPCPMCGEPISVKARKCRYCGERLVTDAPVKRDWDRPPPPSPTKSDEDNLTVGDILLAVFCTNIGCILSIVYLVQGYPKAWKMMVLCIALQIVGVILLVAMEAAKQP